MTATCIAGHDDDPPLALPGLRLCRHHHGRLARDLADIVTCWSLLAELHEPGRGTSGHGKRADPPAPVNLDVADITDPRGQTHAQIAGWARIVIEERRLADRPLDTEQAARLLAVHADWVAAQPWADEALLEIGQAAHRIRRACRDLEPRWIVGTCAMPGPDGMECGGALQVEIQHTQNWDADRDPYDRRSGVRLVCQVCRDTWTEADLDGYMVVNDVWLPIDDAAYQLGVTRRTLNRHAAAGRIRRRRGMVLWSDARSVVQDRGIEQIQ